MDVSSLCCTYLLIITIIGFSVMGVDKKKARMHQYRIPEKTLFAVALFGGSFGCILGMYTFHHKTKHPKFVIGMPIIFIIQALASFCFLYWIL